MQILIKLLVIIVVLACVAPFFIKGPDGKTLFNFDTIHFTLWEEIETLASKALSQTVDQEKPKSAGLQVYKWVDEQGLTHYSDKSESHNSHQLTKIKPISVLPFQKRIEQQKTISSGQSLGLTTIPLQKIPQLIDDAQQVKKIMEGRTQQIDRAIN